MGHCLGVQCRYIATISLYDMDQPGSLDAGFCVKKDPLMDTERACQSRVRQACAHSNPFCSALRFLGEEWGNSGSRSSRGGGAGTGIGCCRLLLAADMLSSKPASRSGCFHLAFFLLLACFELLGHFCSIQFNSGRLALEHNAGSAPAA